MSLDVRVVDRSVVITEQSRLGRFLVRRKMSLLITPSLYSIRSIGEPVFFPEIGPIKHLFGAFERKFRDTAAHDMCNLTNTLVWSEFVHDRNSAVIKDLLIYIVVCIGKRCNLG